jgi:hypothetical protein
MEPEGSLPSSQEPATGSYLRPVHTTPSRGEADYSLYLIPRLRMRGAVPPLL